MIRIQEIKMGDLIRANFEGQHVDGQVTDVNHEDKQVRVQNGDQDDWFDPENLEAIPLDDDQLSKLGFDKEVNDDKSVKYKRGPFRILISAPGKFDDLEIWYREDRRHVHHPIGVHELQNFYHQMTKVDLSRV
jgi:hypothetical protein